MTLGAIRVGIGGWSYEPWRETFYPRDVPKTKELQYAGRQLKTIEINATYYRTQSAANFRKWASETPDDFVFALKASRYACNRSDLAAGKNSIERFVESGLIELGPKLGPLLWQLTPTKKFVSAEIEGFLALLPATIDGTLLRHVLEVRHESFKTDAFLDLARRRNVAVCLSLSDKYPLIADQTADFCYLRLQTTRAEIETGYDEKTLALWAERIARLASGDVVTALEKLGRPPDKRSRDCFVYVIAGAKERNPAAAMALQRYLAT